MVLPAPIAASQVDAKSPVDDTLMESVKEDLEYLDQIQQDTKAFAYEFKFNGYLSNFPGNLRKRVDGALITRDTVFTKARLYLENPGNSGDLVIDARKYRRPNTAIQSILSKYADDILTIANVAPALATQSITRSTSQISTQSISLWKSTINITSIVKLDDDLVRYNLASAPDSDWQVGDSVTFDGTVDAANQITADIIRINDDGHPSIVVENSGAVDEDSSTGDAQLNAWAYNFTNPVSTEFVAGESAVFASHSAAGNNGTFEIYAINSGGNNIVVKNSAGEEQVGVAGNANVSRWVYTFTGLVDTTDFVVGEKIAASGHSNAANDGDFTITAVNQSGFNVVVYNTAGVAQGGVAGTVNTNRWIYTLPTDPTSQFSIGNPAYISGATNPANDGEFTVKQVARSSLNNVVIYNESGVAQGGTAGTLYHGHKIVKFSADMSSIYTIGTGDNDGSRVELFNTQDELNLGSYDVLEVNRGGGSNYNVVINNPSSPQQGGACGRIRLESRSIFKNIPTLTLPTSVLNSTDRHMQYVELDADDDDFNDLATCVAGDIIAADLIEIPDGLPYTAVLQIT